MSRYLLSCVTLVLCLALVLSGCSFLAQSPSPEVRKKEEQMEAMETFLIAHQEEMDALVSAMMELDCDHCGYNVRREELSIRSEKQVSLKKHPIIEKASFLNDCHERYWRHL